MIPYKRDFVTLNKSVINYQPSCSYHLLYSDGWRQELYNSDYDYNYDFWIRPSVQVLIITEEWLPFQKKLYTKWLQNK